MHNRNWKQLSHVATLAIAVVGLVAVGVQAGPVTLDNGVAGDGHLTITVDDYGSFGATFGGGPEWLDLFDPSADPVEGDLTEMSPTFSSNLYFFVDDSGVGNGSLRVALSTHEGIATTYPDPTLNCSISSQNSTANLPLSTTSSFRCIGGSVVLLVTLTQTVGVLPDGINGERRAQLEQTFSIQNAASPVNLTVTKHIDEDMPWGGGANFFLDDKVGVDFSELDRHQIYAQDRELTTAALVIRTREDMELDPLTVPGSSIYYGGKQNTPAPPGNTDFPGGDCPVHDYGTDLQIWDNYGVPNCWKNFIPGVGYDVPGESPVEISGDSFIGLQVTAALVGSSVYNLTYTTTYGNRPPPTLRIPPTLTVQTVTFDQVAGCGEFLWSLKNINPIVTGKDPVLISEFYVNVEAGDGANICTDMTPPDGWLVELCDGFNNNGRALYKFTGGTPIPLNAKVNGRLKIDTNGLSETTNPQTNVVVPPLSVVLHAAQGQDEAVCNFNFGPSGVGDWGIRTIATAHLPVPAMDAWAKTVLALVVAGAGLMLVLRSRRAVA